MMNVKKDTSAKTKNITIRDPRHRRFRTIATALTIIVIVGIIVLNIIVGAVADRYPLTIDMSSDKVFTLSDDGQKFAESVANEVEVVVLADPEEKLLAFGDILEASTEGELNFSRELGRIGREVHTALEQFKKHSNGKITYTFIDPDQEIEKYAKYAEYNLGSEYDLLFISGERYKKASLLTMVEPVDAQTINSKVEHVLISNISALQGDSNRVIQVLTGHDENDATIAGLKTLYEVNGYTFENLNITGSAAFNDNAEVLLIAAPTNDYTPDEIHRITTWLKNNTKRNRHLMVFIDPMANCPNLYEMLKKEYHIEVTDQIIYETEQDRYFSNGTSLKKDYVWADVPYNKYTANATGTAMVKTPQARRLLCDLPNTPTGNGIEDWGLQLATHPNTALVGTLGSDDDLKELKADEYPLVSGVSFVRETTDNNEYQAATTTVTVFGSCAMAYSMYLQDTSTQNEELLLSVIHSVTGYQDTAIVSNKVLAKDKTQFETGTQITLGVWVFSVGLPAVVLLICLVIFLRRRSL